MICYGLSTENPASVSKDYRLEVLAAVQQLDRLDKDKFSDDVREEAAKIRQKRREEELLMMVSVQLVVLIEVLTSVNC